MSVGHTWYDIIIRSLIYKECCIDLGILKKFTHVVKV